MVAIAAALVLLCCATAPKPGMGASIDWRDAQGREGSFASAQGHVVVLDICASWATACNLNARVLDEVAAVMTGEPVEIVSLLVDEGAMGREALRSYRETLGVQHRVLLAGSRVRAGTSVLGDVGGVPRLVVLDKTGAVRIDDSGGVVNVKALVDRLQPLLRADGR